jgi:hypothetical protein
MQNKTTKYHFTRTKKAIKKKVTTAGKDRETRTLAHCSQDYTMAQPLIQTLQCGGCHIVQPILLWVYTCYALLVTQCLPRVHCD